MHRYELSCILTLCSKFPELEIEIAFAWNALYRQRLI